MSSKSKPITPDAAIIENNSTYQVDVIDSTSKNKFLWQWFKEADDKKLGTFSVETYEIWTKMVMLGGVLIVNVSISKG